MKYIFFSLLLLTYAYAAQAETSWEKRLASHEHASENHADHLQKMRETVAEQTMQIKGILETVCDALNKSNLPAKDSLCHELSLLRDCIQSLSLSISSMQEEDLAQLTRINALVLEEIIRQLEHGDLQGICSLEIAKITNMPREWLTLDQLEGLTTQLQNQIINAWNVVTAISFAQPASSSAQQTWDTINNNKAALIVTTITTIAALWAIKGFAYAEDKIGFINNLFKRGITYDLLALYILRQKKDKEITELADQWFGKNSKLGNVLLTLKKYVGSPKEKKTAVHVIARNDMTAQEQVDWADQQNCAVIKTEKGRDCDFLKNFFEIEDGLYKISFGLLFANQLKADIDALSEELSGGALGAYGLFKYLIDLYKPKK